MSAAVVPGEGLPIAVPTALVALALVCALGAAALYARSLSTGHGSPSPEQLVAPLQHGDPAARPDSARAEALVAAGSASPTSAPWLGAPPADGSPSIEEARGTARATPPCEPILVGFGVGQALPSERVAARLRELGRALAPLVGTTVVVDGHADSLGSEDLNLRLSKRRAEAVAWVLENAGVPKASITSRGFGAYSPIEGARDDAEANRRVAIHVRGTCVTGFEEALEP